MVSGSSQGQFLKLLASLTKKGKILEVGTFTGYATSCLWNGVNDREGGGIVLSLERDKRAVELAGNHLKIMEEYGLGAKSATVAAKLRESNREDWKDNIQTEEGHPITFRRVNSECHLVHV